MHLTREQPREKMDRGDDFVLVEAPSQKHYQSSHLPGAINEGQRVVAYCT
jgi:hypothetical protein